MDNPVGRFVAGIFRPDVSVRLPEVGPYERWLDEATGLAQSGLTQSAATLRRAHEAADPVFAGSAAIDGFQGKVRNVFDTQLAEGSQRMRDGALQPVAFMAAVGEGLAEGVRGMRGQ